MIYRLLSFEVCLVILVFLWFNPNADAYPEKGSAFPGNFDRSDLDDLLHSGHPRLVATAEDWERLRSRIPESSVLGVTVESILSAADEMLEKPLPERVLTGRRMLSVSRQVLDHVTNLAAAYRLTDDRRYFERAREELLAVAEFSDWNPSHFLDVAEMTMAVATGYDWLYHDLSEAERAQLRRAIIKNGLQPGSGPPDGINYWKRKSNNWIQVCYGGLVAGALSIAEDEPDYAVEFLHDMFSHIHQTLEGYEPDGVYPEGPGYWSYGTHYNVLLISILESALGTSWNLDKAPGFLESALYINLVIGPTDRFFNYSDNGEDVGALPAVHWFAARTGNAALNEFERRKLQVGSGDKGMQEFNFDKNRRFLPFTLFWMDSELRDDDSTATLPLHWMGDGLNPISIHRSSWKPEGLFLGVKAGRPSNNHGHMDVGSFVLDWKGVRWAFDFEPQSYHSLESIGLSISKYTDPDSDRWRVFRLNNFSHNTLVLDGTLQQIDGFAPITAFSPGPDSPYSVVDMSEVYRNVASRAVRGFRLMRDDAVLVHDELSGMEPGTSIRWGMATQAEIELQGDRAILRQEGETLYAQIVQPIDARFSVEQTDPPPNPFDAPNPGTRMLVVVVRATDEPTDLRIHLSGSPPGHSSIQELRGLPLPSQWQEASLSD